MSALRADSHTLRTTAAAYAELVRVPNLFTAPPDVVLGAALAATTNSVLSVRATAGLALGSMLLYAGGTTLNDYFDAPKDAEERPERPIPSGRVSRSAALLVGLGLLGGGVVIAGAVAGVAGALVAGLLATAVLLYDAVLKGGPAGFLAMGTTRGLNVLLGTTGAVGIVPTELPNWALAVPVVVTVYIAAVTYMAAEEATGVDRRAVVVAGAGAVGAAVSALLLIWTTAPGAILAGMEGFETILDGMDEVETILDGMDEVETTLVGTILTVGFLAWTGRALRGAYRNPVPEVVGPAVGTCILALVVLDGALASVAGVEWTLAVLLFLVPSVGLSRLFDIS